MFFDTGLVSKTCKGTWFFCLDPHRRVSPTQRTTRYSVFKERPRPEELVKNSPRRSIQKYLCIHTACCEPTRRSIEHGQEPLHEPSRGGRRNLRDSGLPVKGHSIAPRRFFCKPEGNLICLPDQTRIWTRAKRRFPTWINFSPGFRT